MMCAPLLYMTLGLLSVVKAGHHDFHSIKVDLSQHVPRMIDLARQTRFPSAELSAAKDSPNITISTGISLSDLKKLRHEWVTTFDWEKEQVQINKFHHFNTSIEGQQLHFIHETSNDPGAIPIVLLHGWPGSFLEMLPMIDLLTSRHWDSSERSNSSGFSVVIPSLPGFGLSAPAPNGWTVYDTARILNTLMSQVLGYNKYAVHGTDWGSAVAYSMYNQFNETVRALHLNTLPFVPPDMKKLEIENITLSKGELLQEQRSLDWSSAGNGYFIESTTKPNTIGLSLYDSPIGQLAWIGEKIISWSDPRRGTGSSLLTNTEILRHVSLYYLTQSFTSSAYIYEQNPNGFSPKYTMAKTDAPLLFSSFNYNIFFWPQQLVEEVGNLVYYKWQEMGGHFPALENPSALADDIRVIATHWSK